MHVEDSDDEVLEEEAADPRAALELTELLLSALVAAATPQSPNYRGNGPEYRRNHRKVRRILRSLGIHEPFPWPTLEEGVAAAKIAHSGSGSYARRRDYFRERSDRVTEVLRTRIADQAAGHVEVQVKRIGDSADDLLADPTAIRAELTRIEASLPLDPSAAIGKAKNLIEATAKAVLTELGEPYKDADKVGKNVLAAMKALGIDRQSMTAHNADIANVMERLSGLTIALSDLRNHAGDGHGMSTPLAGLDLRHGRLAVRSAIAWAAFMLDTLHDKSS